MNFDIPQKWFDLPSRDIGNLMKLYRMMQEEGREFVLSTVEDLCETFGYKSKRSVHNFIRKMETEQILYTVYCGNFGVKLYFDRPRGVQKNAGGGCKKMHPSYNNRNSYYYINNKPINIQYTSSSSSLIIKNNNNTSHNFSACFSLHRKKTNQPSDSNESKGKVNEFENLKTKIIECYDEYRSTVKSIFPGSRPRVTPSGKTWHLIGSLIKEYDLSPEDFRHGVLGASTEDFYQQRGHVTIEYIFGSSEKAWYFTEGRIEKGRQLEQSRLDSKYQTQYFLNEKKKEIEAVEQRELSEQEVDEYEKKIASEEKNSMLASALAAAKERAGRMKFTDLPAREKFIESWTRTVYRCDVAARMRNERV